MKALSNKSTEHFSIKEQKSHF